MGGGWVSCCGGGCCWGCCGEGCGAASSAGAGGPSPPGSPSTAAGSGPRPASRIAATWSTEVFVSPMIMHRVLGPPGTPMHAAICRSRMPSPIGPGTAS